MARSVWGQFSFLDEKRFSILNGRHPGNHTPKMYFALMEKPHAHNQNSSIFSGKNSYNVHVGLYIDRYPYLQMLVMSLPIPSSYLCTVHARREGGARGTPLLPFPRSPPTFANAL